MRFAAMCNRWRTYESTLHILGLIGGWPGALIVQRMFRHKNRKRKLHIVFWLSVTINCGLLVWPAAKPGATLIRQFAPRL
jgi:uncharacterized membrane protein YsdA (DUF1294 family)